jgi:predicted phage baseplate assembly protein
VTRDAIVARCLDALRTGLPDLAVDNPDDPAVALVGAWATVVDTLDFYRDRIAAEGYVATAVDDRSALELGRAVGAGPVPAAGASVLLSFTADQVPEVVVAAGTAVHSIPAQDETTQVFETDAELRVRPERNSVPLRQRRPQRPSGTTNSLRVRETTLRAGDHVLVRAGTSAYPRVLSGVHIGQPEPGVTTVEWAEPVAVPAGADVEAHVFRVRTALFGQNAPDWTAMPADVKLAYGGADADDWPGLDDVVASTGPIADTLTVELAGDHPSIGIGSWLLLRAPGEADVLRTVLAVRTSAAADFAVAGPVTLVTLGGEDTFGDGFTRRTATVLAQSEPLTLADEPDPAEVTGPVLDLAEPVRFTPGAPVIVVGRDTGGTLLAQSGTVAAATGSTLVLTGPLASGIVQASGIVLGNVVAGTAGETVAEVLGDGDGSAAHQWFPVRRAAVGYVPAPGGDGLRSTLDVRVDDVSWAQVPEMLSAGPADRVFCVREDVDGTAVVSFGDGVHGARLTTGTGNVVAVYRTASGRAANVGAGTLRLLPISPLGVTGVDNPRPATGGTDRRPVDLKRIPYATGVLDRVVSPADHLALALAFAGVRTAALTVFTRGTRPIVHLDVVPVDGAGRVVDDLRAALRAVRSPEGDLDVQQCQEVEFEVAFDVVLEQPGDTRVTDAVSSAVRATFGAQGRAIAEPVALSQLVAVAQRVPGVAAVRPTALHRHGAPAALAQVLDARAATLGPSGVVAAQLLVVHEAGVREVTR